MTTAIPLFFKPVLYQNEMYVDGGLRGHFPIEVCNSKNYLGLFIMGGAINSGEEIMQLFPILEFVYSLMINQDDIVYQIKKGNSNKKIIYNEIKLGLNFDVKDHIKDKVIQLAYNNTIKHINLYLK